MGKQHNRRIFAGFYKRYDNKYIYVVAVVPDVDSGSQVVIFHEGIDACECKYYSMTKQSFCEMVEVDGEWVDKFTRQPQIRITDTHIQNLIDGGFSGPVRKKKPKDEDLLAYESADSVVPKPIPPTQKISASITSSICADTICAWHRNGISAYPVKRTLIFSKRTWRF